MDIITTVVLSLTLVGMALGALFGFLRGRERALLRLVLVIISAILAIALRGVIVDAIMNIDIDGSTLKESFFGVSSSDSSTYVAVSNLLLVIFEILMGIVAYFILLFSLRFLTWLLVFPFLKLIIRKFESEPYGNRGQGALVGLAQGILLSYFLFAPLTCLLTQVNQFASIELNNEPLFNMPGQTEITEYTESSVGKFYNATGRWYYNMMTTSTAANANGVSLDDISNSVSTVIEIANVVTSLEDELEIINSENATPEEKINSFNILADKMISLGTSMSELDDNTKEIINDLFRETDGENTNQEEIDDILEILTPELFTQAGHAMKSYAEYEQVKLDGASLGQDKADEIINNVYGAINIMDEVELEVNDADKSIFKAAIDSNADIAAEDVPTMYKIFGIKTP